MVYSQPAYIIKCTSDKGWLCLCFFNSTTLPFFLSPFLQALFEWSHAISLPPFFIPLVIASVSGAQLACFCREGRRKKKSPIQIVESLYVQVSDQHGCTLKCLHCRLDAEALSPHQPSVSLSLEDVKGCRITPTGCWQKQQLDLTKKKEVFQLAC